MNNLDFFEPHISTLEVIMRWTVPIVMLVTAFICLNISKNHIYRSSLLLSSLAFFFITIAWSLPLIAEHVIAKFVYDGLDDALEFTNGLSSVLFIVGHVLLAITFFKLRHTKT